MQVKKTYRNVNPELLYDEARDFIVKQGATLGEKKLETYSVPGGSSHVARGTLTFFMPAQGGKGGRECVRVHIVGSADGETKMMLDIDEKLFPPASVAAFEEDLAFIFGSSEVKG